MPSVDVCIVSTRRPDLLATTLESFSKRVISNFTIGSVFMNLDSVFGSDEDHARCIEIFMRYFPDGILFQPDVAGFAAAVKRLWAATKSDFVLHLEDDWIALANIGDEALSPFSNQTVAQVSFHTAEKKWDIAKKGHFHRRNEYLKVLGIKIPTFKTFPIFTTSPCILRGEFARSAAALLDVTKDPEKQFYYGVNKPLESHVKKIRSYIYSPSRTPVIADIGREWQKSKNIRKTIRNAISFWDSN